MKCLVIRHGAFEELGAFLPVLEGLGFQITYVEAGVDPVNEGEWLSADLLIVLGGPGVVMDTDTHPWVNDEVRVLSLRLSQERPTLGICLGAQLTTAPLQAGTRMLETWLRRACPLSEHATRAQRTYEPVNCEFHDILESLATQRKRVKIEIRTETGAVVARVATIADVFAKAGCEYLKLDDGEFIRLDALIAVDGIPAKSFD